MKIKSNKTIAVNEGLSFVNPPAEDVKAPTQDIADKLFLVDAASKIIEKTGEVGVLYLELCKGIREKQMSPRLVGRVLGELGFHKVRISEIIRVSMSPNDIWNDYMGRQLGFNKTLQLARMVDGKAVHSPAMKLLADGGNLPESEFGEAESETIGGAPKKHASKSKNIRIRTACQLLCKLAAIGYQYHSDDGLKCITVSAVTKDPTK